jgi:beta-glucanase (GH16 family)
MKVASRILLLPLLLILSITVASAQDAPEDLIIDDFEGALWAGTTPDGAAGIGMVPWGDTFENVNLSVRLLLPESVLALPERDGEVNDVLAVAYDIDSWGGFTHAFTDGTEWTSQDWTTHNAVSFWLFGNDTGGSVQMDLFDNRSTEVSGDSAERWYYRLDDDYTGWRQFSIPFALFQRRTDFQPNGAPDDGLGLDQVSGYAFGFPGGVGAQIAYLDDLRLVTLEDTSAVVSSAEIVETPAPVVEVDDSVTWDSREWMLVWSDEFEGAAGTPVNEENWTAEIGGSGWGNNELEYYTDRVENASLDGDGNLSIVARQESLGNACHYGLCDYTSARLISRDKVELTYGRVEARIRVPYGQGIWPAFWMLGGDINQVGWPQSGEIDIMENIGREPRIAHGTVHGPGYSGAEGIVGNYPIDEDFADDFHVFAIDWDPGIIRWYIDGNLYHVVTPDDLDGDEWVFDHDFFLLLNVAVGGYWPGIPDATTEFPQTMLVDYVRVYTLAGDS